MKTINYAGREWVAIEVEPTQLTVEGVYKPSVKTYILYTLRVDEELMDLQTVYIPNLDKWMVICDVLGDGVYNVWIDELCAPTDISGIDAGTSYGDWRSIDVGGKPWNK